MRNLFKKAATHLKGTRAQKGQVLIIVVFAMVALISLVGLVVDTGITFIQYGRLRRAVDAAALSASLQYRENVSVEQLTLAATEFLVLNDINDPTAQVITCDMDMSLCDKNGDGVINGPEQRKFVRVVATSNAVLAFMPVLGIRTIPLEAEAVSEAASLDVVLVIDTSESMTFDAPPGDNMRDPSQCNSAVSGGPFTGDCSPFLDVKVAASSFIDQLYFPYDHVAVITFDNNVHIQSTLQECGDNPANCEHHVQTVIQHLDVLQVGAGVGPGTEGDCDFSIPASGPCRRYDATDHHYVGFDCPIYWDTGDPASCTTTNIGGGLQAAANEFSSGFREESLWVIILLTDGAANSSENTDGFHPWGYCPAATHEQPFCRDKLVSTRHCAVDETRTRCEAEGGTWDPANYDADDFAHDMADFAGRDQNALIFTIGLGNQVTDAQVGDPNAGEALLQYTADAGRGLYFFAPSGDDLRDIFKEIANNIAVRLTH